MPLMEWTDSFSVGVKSIDDQHKQFIVLVNDLYDAIKAGNGEDVVNHTLHGLITYTMTHFDYEEKLFAQSGYPNTAAHKKEHEHLKKEVFQIQEEIKEAVSFEKTMELLVFLKNWMINHILVSDKTYTQHLIEKGIK